MKKCCECKEEKQETEFGKNIRAKDGLAYRCFDCKKKMYSRKRDSILSKRRSQQQVTYARNKDKILAYSRSRVEEKAAYDKEYRKLKQERIREYKKVWAEKAKSDPIHRTRMNARRLVCHAIKDGLDSKKFFDLVGCNRADFIQYIESQWKEGMSWENYGINGWNIDHIIPCVAFDLSLDEEIKKCFHFSNCRPLWAEENSKKAYLHKGQNCKLITDKTSINK